MVLHLRAPKGKVSVEVMLNRAKYFDRTGKVNDHTIYLSGNLGKKCPGICHVPVGKSNGRPCVYHGSYSGDRRGREDYRKAGARDGAEQRTQNHSPSGAAEGVGSWRSESLRLVGNASIALAWENGKLTRCAVTADQAYEGEVVYGEMRQAVKLEKGETVMLDAVLQLLES
mgnify:CR=1 FL=1